MEERSGLIKDHKPVKGMYSEADYKELLALAQRNEGRVCSLSATARELKDRLAELVEAVRWEREFDGALVWLVQVGRYPKDTAGREAILAELECARAAVDALVGEE
jgi:hypothetical protein